MNSSRPSWDEYFLALAGTASLRADCLRRKCGAVLVSRDNRVISTGYNGAPSGAFGCLSDNACPRGQMSYEEVKAFSSYANCIAFHAEKNAILWCPPEERYGTRLYVNQPPCPDCRVFAAACGVKEIIWKEDGFIKSTRPQEIILAKYYLRYTFLREVDVYQMDETYQKNYMKNMLQKIVGPSNLHEYDQTEVLDETYVPKD